ncbi:hypothetical protein CLOM_g17823 [Closterium sp. NIES-68]|nr:hypothetical protein CLOM_g17823 [Closterium sp. NIES-68]
MAPVAAGTDDRQVQVRFTTRLPAHLTVPSTPFAVPVRLTRYGLSEVINTLLGRDAPQPFDFIVDGRLLRSSLRKCLLTSALSTERVIPIEYTLADWVSAVSAALPSAIVSGSYDSHVRLFSVPPASAAATTAGPSASTDATAAAGAGGADGGAGSGSASCIQVAAAHSDAVTHIAALPAANAFVSSSKDRTLRLWQLSGDSSEPSTGPSSLRAAVVAVMRGHAAAVQCAAVHARTNKLASGGWDSAIKLWSLPKLGAKAGARGGEEGRAGGDGEGGTGEEAEGEEGAGEGAEGRGQARKRVRTAAGSVEAEGVELSPDLSLEGHSQCVAALAWPSSNSPLFSVSWDHSLRSWDVEAAASVSVRTSAHPLLAVAAGGGGMASLAAVGGAHPTILLWDMRSATSVLSPSVQLLGHTDWISSLSWSPSNPLHLLSSSYDGSLKIWDLRSSVPLHTVKAHSDKVLCADWWKGGDAVVSGGADNHLRIFTHQSSFPAA